MRAFRVKVREDWIDPFEYRFGRIRDANAQSSESRTVAMFAEAGWATGVFNMQGVAGCNLDVRIDGTAYLVNGSELDDHGDAHVPDGLCNTAILNELSLIHI